MMSFHRITNKSVINSYFIKDDLYKSILCVASITDIKIPKADAVLVVTKNNEEIGLVLLQDLKNGYVNFHAGLFKEFRHKNTAQILKQTLKVIKRLVFPLHLVTTVPVLNIAAQKIDERAGFRYKRTVNIKDKQYRLYVE